MPSAPVITPMKRLRVAANPDIAGHAPPALRVRTRVISFSWRIVLTLAPRRNSSGRQYPCQRGPSIKEAPTPRADVGPDMGWRRILVVAPNL